jgi:hypothetical protein
MIAGETENKKMVKKNPAALRRDNGLATKFIKSCKRRQLQNII